MDNAKELLANLLYPVIYPITRLQQKSLPINVLSEDETLDRLIKGCSISRFGDGEIGLILRNYGIWFQDFDPGLKERLLEIISLNMEETPNFLVATYPEFNTYKGYQKKEVRFWAKFSVTKRKSLRNLLNANKANQVYGNAIFNRFADHKTESTKVLRERAKKLKELWNDKSLLIIEGDSVKLGVDTDLFSNTKNVYRILIPSYNSWQFYDEILKTALDFPKPDLILAVAGPTASVLAYDLYKKGCQTIDMGQLNYGYSELVQNSDVTRLTEDSYQKQIVCVIGEQL